MEIFRTRRLRLTKVTREDEAMLRLLYSDNDVMRFYPAERSLDLAPIFVTRTLEMYERYGFGLYNVRLIEDDTFIGQCGFVPANVEGESACEVMIFLHRSFWRDDYAQEVTRATTAFGLKTLALGTVSGLIYPNNRPSKLLARRCGFIFVRTVAMREGPMELYTCSYQPDALYTTQQTPYAMKPDLSNYRQG